ncbi:multiheme c-type cytochrome [Pseudodesulfovibrio cashew]|nr:multiheme c-type cytochrome [Pseudodesulfovibrio cashew]
MRNCMLLSCLLLCLAAASAHAASIRNEGVVATAPPETYAGSKACAQCHETQYEQWSKTLKARFVRYRRDLAALPGDWGKSPLRADDVFLVVGLHRKAAFVDTDWRVLPAEYRFDKHRWNRKPGWGGRDYRQRCGMCHLTGCNPYEKRYTELGVGCEACHGPGREHIQEESAETIATPGRDGKPVLDTCRRCHNGRNNHADAIRGFAGTYHETD